MIHLKATWRAALLLAVLATAPAAAHEYKLGSLRIIHPTTRETPIAGGTALGDLTIENTGADDDRLLGARSDAVASIEIHQMSGEGGVMRMRAQTDGLRLPARATTALGADAPGGYHLMLIGVKAQLKAGDKLPVTLRFAKAGEIKLEFLVQPLTAVGAEAPGH